jgi:hypothetical protein
VPCLVVFSLDVVPAPNGDILTRGTLRDTDRERDRGRDRDSAVDKSPTAKLSELPSLAGCSSFGERVIFLRSNLKSLTAKVEVSLLTLILNTILISILVVNITLRH